MVRRRTGTTNGRRAARYICLLLTLFLLACTNNSHKSATSSPAISSIRTYDYSEGLAVVGMTDSQGNTTYQVIRTDGSVAFTIGLDSCIIGTTFQNGLLWYFDTRTGLEGYLDRQGNPTTARPATALSYAEANTPRLDKEPSSSTRPARSKPQAISNQDWSKVTAQNPFYNEAKKILSGQLTDIDASNRQMILNYCEHLRTAYTTKDIDFLRQVFSDDALIIVGHVIRTATGNGIAHNSRVTYSTQNKQEYLQRVSRVFAANKAIDISFSHFTIRRHPTMEGIYGVTLRQQYHADRYEDDGWLFLLWDFRDVTAPMIHIRTWQAAMTDGHVPLPEDSVISIRDFNLK